MASGAKTGQIVWAKVKGSCPWPAKGIDPIPEIKRPSKKGNWYFVRFFGSNDHAWVDFESNIWPYKEYRVRYGEKDKCPQNFRDAVLLADEEYADPSAHDERATSMDVDKVASPETKTKSKVAKEAVKEHVKETARETVKETAKESAKESAKELAKESAKESAKENADESQKEKVPPKPKKSVALKRKADDNTKKSESNDEKQVNGEVPKQENNTEPVSPSKSPRFSRNRTSFSPRQQGLKAKVYDFVDSDVSSPTHIVSDKTNIRPSSLKIGFLGLGTMGLPLVKNLVKYGHQVTVWNRTAAKSAELADVDIEILSTPAAVVAASDVTIACLSDPFAVKEVLFCKNGVLEGISPGKGFIDMSTVDVETVTDADEQIQRLGGLYLEAPIIGSKNQAVSGSLVIMASGSEKLYEMCKSCFQSISSKSYFLGGVGNGTRMKLCLNMMMGIISAGVAEGMALAERVGLQQKDLYSVLCNSPMNCSLVTNTAKAVEEEIFNPQLTLKHMQKDLRLAIDMADMYDQPLPVTASANELYKRAKSLGMGNLDSSSVYKACK